MSILDGDDDELEDESADDDLLGGADDGLMGGEMGFADDDDGGSDDEELSYRLDEIEKEIDSLEGQVETVRGENEKISDSIQTVERNVDRLVDMYEIVTQGINPFVGDQEIGDAFETATGDGGVFGGDDPADDIDDDITNAEAEDFLDDDLEEDDDEDDFVADEFDEGGEIDDPLEEDEDGFDDSSEDEALEDDPFADEFDDGSEDDGELGFDEEDEELADENDDLELEEEAADPEPEPIQTEVVADQTTDTEDTTQTGSETAALGENGEMGDPPYLVRHPSRTDAELVTIEWLQYLIETAGMDGAARTIAYYESIDWISDPVETYLQSLLNGFSDAPVADDEIEPRSVLTTDEHKRSLQYIANIATPEKATELSIEPPVEADTADPSAE
ncbi:FlaD/FlaE family flagellar protein [Halopiger aswanensis]|nr:FlaD/FlaE family flagellar protein [Halopiger aswanensis]